MESLEIVSPRYPRPVFGRSSELNETHMKPKLTGWQHCLNDATFGAEESGKYISKREKMSLSMWQSEDGKLYVRTYFFFV